MKTRHPISIQRGLRCVPPAPEVMANLYERFYREAKPHGIGFPQFLGIMGYTNPAANQIGRDDGVDFEVVNGAPRLISTPTHEVREGTLHVVVLLIEFSDHPASESVSYYEDLLFSKDNHATGSMRDYYQEVSLGNIDVVGSVHGWFLMPQKYSYYVNGDYGGDPDAYPRNAPRMAEDAITVALENGVTFGLELDFFESGTITALFIVHAGPGAESILGPDRKNHIWSHKWGMRYAKDVGDGLIARRYLTVPENSRLGVCAHELGHLAFEWDDFYDPNYDKDGIAWDGAGDWDLMAGGSYNGSSRSPAHPAALHKSQHGWIDVKEIRATQAVSLPPHNSRAASAIRVRSPHYAPEQFLLLENRSKFGFDTELPGEGLLVWRVDLRGEMTSPLSPAMLLIQADGRHDLERVGDNNAGDAGDPFPGTTGRLQLLDSGDISTTFPDGDRSEVLLKNIRRDDGTGEIHLDITIGSDETVVTTAEPVFRRIDTVYPIADADPQGISSAVQIDEPGQVQGLEVAVDISHTYIGDLRVELISPSGERALLHDREGRNARDIRQAYSSDSVPSLANLIGNPVRGEWALHVSDLARWDEGQIDEWSIRIFRTAGEATDGTVRKESDFARPLKIPDNDPVGVASVLNIPRSGRVRNLQVEVGITHPYIGDLLVELIGPSGDRAILHNRTGGRTKNLNETYTLQDYPALAVFGGLPARGDWILRVGDLARADKGTLDRWAIEIGLASGTDVARGEETRSLAIPDNTPAGVGSAIHIGETGTAQSIRVEVDIAHTYIGDLRIELVAPNGDRALLRNKTGGGQVDLLESYDPSSHPALASLVGLSIEGEWVLRVSDMLYRDSGTLRSWRIELPYTS